MPIYPKIAPLAWSFGLVAALTLGCRSVARQGGDGSTVQEATAADPAISYGDLAKSQLQAVFANATAQARAFTDQTRPEDAKTLRKALDKARDFIDILVFALPADDHEDFFFELRPVLDQGYEQVGLFKDLYDIPLATGKKDIVYDPKQLDAARAPVKQWLARYLDPAFQKRLAEFLGDISASRARDRHRSDLSKFYWRSVDHKPSFETPAREALHTITKGQIDQLQDEEPGLLALPHLFAAEDIDHFHTFRKRARVVVEIYSYFPTVLASSGQAQSELKLLQEVVSRYGEFHDRLVGYENTVKAADTATVARLQVELDGEWNQLKAWQRANLHLAAIEL